VAADRRGAARRPGVPQVLRAVCRGPGQLLRGLRGGTRAAERARLQVRPAGGHHPLVNPAGVASRGCAQGYDPEELLPFYSCAAAERCAGAVALSVGGARFSRSSHVTSSVRQGSAPHSH